ncbi:MAG: hypothetical protein RQ741_00460 [Wenzhouxiangellaceae bacterium]|nr:hypothetical protein [Wenzhouxiangellaceae bacterium]
MLNTEQQQLLLRWLLSDFHSHSDLESLEKIEPIVEAQIRIMEVPERPIIKLAKKCHVDDFFRYGALQLGSFNYYASYDHTEVGDKQEGIVTAIATADWGIVAGNYGSGFDNYVLCATSAPADVTVSESFGYDSGFIIADPDGFAKAIQKSVGSGSYIYGMCEYNAFKAIIGANAKEIDRYSISHETAKMITAAKYFVKPLRYAHQDEFRFLWDASGDLHDAEIVHCPEAIRFCRKLPV